VPPSPYMTALSCSWARSTAIDENFRCDLDKLKQPAVNWL